MIDRTHSELSLVRQCELLGLHRSGLYYPSAPESEKTRVLMRLIDEQYLKTPFYGSRQMTSHLIRLGYPVNRKRVQRLMMLIGLQAVAPGPHTSQPHPAHPVYPYRLRGMTIDRPNQVWAVDITYVPLARGFMYLVAFLDWATRKVLSWRVSNTLDTAFCVEALQDALREYGQPDIVNTDQGCQFTSEVFTGLLKTVGIQISMDGRGRCHDNIFIERLWRTVKYECIYLNAFEDGHHLREALGCYFNWYNQERPHTALGGVSPDTRYFVKPNNQSLVA